MKILGLVLFTISCTIDLGYSQLSSIWWVYLKGGTSEFKTLPAGTYDFHDGRLLFDSNDVRYRYVGNSSSMFANQFALNSTMLEAKRLLLVFHGLDTIATIELNSHEIGRTSNMFIRYVFDIKDYVINNTNDNNKLIVYFESAVKAAERIYNNQSQHYIVYPKCVPDDYKGECHVNHIRKMQASFGWDWGPAFPGSAIWRDVQLIPVNQAVIMDHTIDVYQAKPGKTWEVNVTVLLEVAPNSPSEPVAGTLKATLETDDQDIVNVKKILINNGTKKVIISVTLNVPETSVQRWWPNGYGAQVLYNLTTQLKTTIGTELRRKRIGFRTVELVQEPLKKGLSFYFRINDVPIFAKGSNVIPIKILPEIADNRTYVRHLLKLAKDVHMNMLRIWGGGVYESDYLYDVADEFGIMVWQDFMFACAMYPTTSEFLESVREEVVQNVRRLKSHPSVVLWAGNNENEAALYGNWYGTGKDRVYKDDYIKLYVDVIKREVEKVDPNRPFVVSSPSNGRWADENGWIGTDPYSPLYGDIHYYNYLANGWNINTYPRPRFSSEYGLQSLPSIHNLKPVASHPDDLTMDSSFMKHRQHLHLGNGILKLLISQNLEIPQSNDAMLDFRNYIYLSQINQAQSIKVQTESYRQARSSLNDAGEGNTMGALYWQLNDIWQAPSWSSIDTDGRWKMLHNYAKDFFAPIIISPRLSITHDLTIFIISDELSPRFNCLAELNVHKIWRNIQPDVFTRQFYNVTVKANAAYELASVKLEDVLKEASCGDDIEEAKKKCIVELILKDASGEEIAPPNYVYPAPPKNMDLPACELIASFDPTNVNNRYRVTIDSSCGTQLFVWFDFPGYMQGRFSENGFPILQRRKIIYYHPDFDDQYIVNTDAFSVVTLGQIYSSPQPANRVCLDCIRG